VLAGDLTKGAAPTSSRASAAASSRASSRAACHEPAERVMGHVSRDKLLDLTDLEQPLLKKMAAEAPGSWEHARAMANLAEASAAAIHADALLTRVGAYYHDLGKTVQPKYFIENLAARRALTARGARARGLRRRDHGARRDGHEDPPRRQASPSRSSSSRTPTTARSSSSISGTSAREQGNPKGLGEEHFRYPGMKPQTKETAILMLVDSIEAASRTIWPPEHKKFEEMIQRVIFTKLSAGQLDESGLTIEDLRVMTSRMASTLVNMYHGRIKYPWQREAEEAAARAQREGAETTPVSGFPAPRRRARRRAQRVRAQPGLHEDAQPLAAEGEPALALGGRRTSSTSLKRRNGALAVDRLLLSFRAVA
jgi:putative nucleotidyltransferase with HDIG domain